MLVLTQTTDTLQVVLAGSITTNQLQCVASWRDITSTPTYTPGRSVANTNNTTDVSLVGSPAASTQRLIDYVSIYNADTVAATVTVKLDANGTEYILARQLINPGQSLVYTDDAGWFVVGSPIPTDWTYVILGANAATTSATAVNTDLAFAPAANTRYEFEAKLFLQTNTTTVGARPGLSWPSGVSQNSAWAIAPNSATAFATQIWGATVAGSALSTGLPVINEGYYAQITGMLVMGASPSGNLTVTLASETALTEVRMMQNSFLRYRTY